MNVRQIFILATVIVLSGCYADKADQLYPEPGTTNNPGGGGGNTNTCDTANMKFAEGVLPILNNSCTSAGCHIGGTSSGSYNLTTYDGTKLAVTNGKLLGAINHQSGFVAMPQGMAKLSDCNINKITAWVNQGALNN